MWIVIFKNVETKLRHYVLLLNKLEDYYIKKVRSLKNHNIKESTI